MRPDDESDLVLRILHHIDQVRHTERRLETAQAMVLIENNHSDWLTDNFYRLLEHAVDSASGPGRRGTIAVLDLEQALHEAAATTGQTRARRARGEAGSVRERIARLAVLPNVAPGDRHGIIRRGARTTPEMKPLMCDLLRRMLHEGRVVVHEEFVALVSPTPERFERFLDRLIATTDAQAVGALLTRSGVAAGQAMATGSELERRFFHGQREEMLQTLAAQFRGFREHHDVVTRRDGRIDESIELTGKRREGPHRKKDDLVMAMALLVYSAACVATLPTLAREKQLLRMD